MSFALARPENESMQPGALSLQEAIWASVRSRSSSLVTTTDFGAQEKVEAFGRLMASAGPLCRWKPIVDLNGRLGFSDEAIIILEFFNLLSPDLLHILKTSARFPRNYAIADDWKPGANFLRDTFDGSQLYPGMEHVGLLYYTRARDSYDRPFIWVTGTTALGMMIAAQWLTDGHVEIAYHPCCDTDPIEIAVTPQPYISDIAGDKIGLNHLAVRILCGDYEYNMATREWYLRKVATKRPKVMLHFEGGILKSITVKGTVKGAERITIVTRGTIKFSLLSTLVREKQAGRWNTLESLAKDGSESDGSKYDKSKLHSVRTRLYEIGQLADGLLQIQCPAQEREYLLNASIDSDE